MFYRILEQNYSLALEVFSNFMKEKQENEIFFNDRKSQKIKQHVLTDFI